MICVAFQPPATNSTAAMAMAVMTCGMDEIKKMLKERAQPRRPPAPDVSGKVFDLGETPIEGESTAKITLVEFTDYQ